MKNNSILVISNSVDVGKEIVSKVRLLRENDSVRVVSYIESISVLHSSDPSLILLYCANYDSIGIVNEIRKLKFLDKVPIIFITDNFVEDLLLYAFDNGVDDFFFLSDPDSIVLIRIFLTLQKAVLYKKTDIDKEVLTSAGLLDKETGIYKKEQAQIVLRSFFAKCIEENCDDTLFMYIKPVATLQKKLNLNKVASVIQSTLRGNDILAFGRNQGFYVVIYDSDIKGAKATFARIKSKLNDICEVYANCATITAAFEETEPVLYEEMKSQIAAGNDFAFLPDIAINDNSKKMNITDENGKKLSDFKKEFFESIEKIISPVFSKAKEDLVNSLPKVQVDYKVAEKESSFSLKSGSTESEVIITYPTYSKLIIDIKLSAKGISPVIRRLVYDFEEFSQEKLDFVLKDTIDEFTEKAESAPSVGRKKQSK